MALALAPLAVNTLLLRAPHDVSTVVPYTNSRTHLKLTRCVRRFAARFYQCHTGFGSIEHAEATGGNSYHAFGFERAVRLEWVQRGVITLFEPPCDGFPFYSPSPPDPPSPPSPPPLPPLLPLPSSPPPAPPWEKHAGLNCYDSRGGDTIAIDSSPRTLSIQACKRLCEADAPRCAAITVRQSSLSCWRRTTLLLDQCATDRGFDTYTRNFAPPSPPMWPPEPPATPPTPPPAPPSSPPLPPLSPPPSPPCWPPPPSPSPKVPPPSLPPAVPPAVPPLSPPIPLPAPPSTASSPPLRPLAPPNPYDLASAHLSGLRVGIGVLILVMLGASSILGHVAVRFVARPTQSQTSTPSDGSSFEYEQTITSRSSWCCVSGLERFLRSKQHHRTTRILDEPHVAL